MARQRETARAAKTALRTENAPRFQHCFTELSHFRDVPHMFETVAECNLAVRSMDRASSPRPAVQRGWSRRSIPVLIGALLVTAAVFKTHRLWKEPDLSAQRLLESPWFQVVLIEVEFVLGAALLLQIQPRLCKVLAIGLFTAFLSTVLPQAIEGRVSCACLGNVELSPWLAAGVDLASLLLLFCWPARNLRLSQSRQRAAPFIAVSGACLIIVPAGWYWNSNEPSYPALQNSTPVLETGDLAQGERRTLRLLVQNPHERDVHIERIDSSCPCLHALDLPWRFLPNEQKTVLLELDMEQERVFSGSLRIEYNAMTGDGKEGLHGYILAQVN